MTNLILIFASSMKPLMTLRHGSLQGNLSYLLCFPWRLRDCSKGLRWEDRLEAWWEPYSEPKRLQVDLLRQDCAEPNVWVGWLKL